ncbi:MAG: ankyrin repeat domain-containing protein [Clostridia bacterium]|nr:ankyrin repeat domain-containing protein [Clostridia bacterium]
MKNSYSDGNLELLKMIESGNFDEMRAKELIDNIKSNKINCFPSSADGLSDSSNRYYTANYLLEAVYANNLPAVAFLLDNGADPNLIDDEEECALWALQYLDQNQDWQTRYEIAKLFFQHGANPNLEIDQESLYDYVQFKIWMNEENSKNDMENLLQLFKLLVLYGGGGKSLGREYPKLSDNVDLNRIDEYEFILDFKGKYHNIYVEKLVDKGGNTVATIRERI